jgi:hypothetical protein
MRFEKEKNRRNDNGESEYDRLELSAGDPYAESGR